MRRGAGIETIWYLFEMTDWTQRSKTGSNANSAGPAIILERLELGLERLGKLQFVMEGSVKPWFSGQRFWKMKRSFCLGRR